MKFSKRLIAEFKAKRRFYITWRKNLKPHQIKEIFYNEDEKHDIKELFPGKKIEYCHSYMYDIVVGDYKLGLRYVNEKETYYMFWSANSFWSYPQDIAVGKAIDKKIYLVCEHFPNGNYGLNFRIIPEEYINKNERGFRPKSYNHSIFVIPFHIEEVIKEITDEDVKCLKNAYEGIKAFSTLIEKSIKKHNTDQKLANIHNKNC